MLLLFFRGEGAPVVVSYDLREAVYARLAAISSLTAVTSTRIRPGFRPQSDTQPSVSYTVIDTVPAVNLAAGAGYAIARVQIDCWGRTFTECITAKNAIREELHGTIGGWTGLTVYWCKIVAENDFSEAPVDGSDRWMFRISLDLWVKYILA